MGDSFLDSVQGLKELKIFGADAAQHCKMNETSEEFRKITMKVLVMQLASTTIMDLVAYGGAGLGIAMALLSVTRWGLSPIAAIVPDSGCRRLFPAAARSVQRSILP